MHRESDSSVMLGRTICYLAAVAAVGLMLLLIGVMQ